MTYEQLEALFPEARSPRNLTIVTSLDAEMEINPGSLKQQSVVLPLHHGTTKIKMKLINCRKKLLTLIYVGKQNFVKARLNKIF